MRRVGTVNRPQDNLIAVNQMCMTRGTIHHEFLHTLGFSHEHVRHDRDQYIKFNDEGFDHDHCESWGNGMKYATIYRLELAEFRTELPYSNLIISYRITVYIPFYSDMTS